MYILQQQGYGDVEKKWYQNTTILNFISYLRINQIYKLGSQKNWPINENTFETQFIHKLQIFFSSHIIL